MVPSWEGIRVAEDTPGTRLRAPVATRVGSQFPHGPLQVLSLKYQMFLVCSHLPTLESQWGKGAGRPLSEPQAPRERVTSSVAECQAGAVGLGCQFFYFWLPILT